MAATKVDKTRHLWVGGLPEDMTQEEIQEYFSKFGKVEGVKLLPQRYPNVGLAAFIDFHECDDAVAAHSANITIKGCEVRTNYKSVRDKSEKEHSHRYYNSPDKEEGKKQNNSSSSSTSAGSSSSESDGESSSSSSSSDTEGDNEKVRKKGKEKFGLVLKVTNLAQHRPEPSVHEALYYEFYNYSVKPEVRLYGEGDKRYALVKFKSSSESKSAFKGSQGMAMFGTKLKITDFHKEDFPSGGRDLPYPPPVPPHAGGLSHGPLLGFSHGNPFLSPEDLDPNATRSLFVGNIPKNISIYELRDVFQRFGPILDVEIKKMSGNATYGFILFYDLLNAINAKRGMDGTQLGGNKIRVGFGKGTPSKVLWVDGIDISLSEAQIEAYFSKYGTVTRLGVDRSTYTAMVQFETIDEAKEALSGVKGGFIGNTRSKIMADFANRDAKAAFFTRLENPGGPSRPYPMYPDHLLGPSMMRHRPIPIIPGMPPPPLDYYGYHHYMEADYYGYSHYPPPGAAAAAMRHYSHPYESHGYSGGDFEDDLREFSRRRERDRQKDKEKNERKKRRRGSRERSSSESDRSTSEHHKKSKRKRKQSTSSKSDDSHTPRKEREKGKRRDGDHDKKRVLSDDEDSRSKSKVKDKVHSKHQSKQEEKSKVTHETGKGKDKEPPKRPGRVTKRGESSKEEMKSEASSKKSPVKSEKRVITDTHEITKDKVKQTEDDVQSEVNLKMNNVVKSEEKDTETIVDHQQSARDNPKVVITYEDAEELDEEIRPHVSPPSVKGDAIDILPLEPIPLNEPVDNETVDDQILDTVSAVPEITIEEPQVSAVTDNAEMLESVDRPKISIAWKEREKPLKLDRLSMLAPEEEKSSSRIESDFSSGDEFNHIEEETLREVQPEWLPVTDESQETVHKKHDTKSTATVSTAKRNEKEGSKGSAVAKKESDDRLKEKADKKSAHTSEASDRRGSHRHDDREHGRRYSRSPHSRRHHSSEQHQRRRPLSPSHRQAGSPRPRTPTSPLASRGRRRSRTPIQRPAKTGNTNRRTSPSAERRGRYSHASSPHHRHRSPTPPHSRSTKHARERSPIGNGGRSQHRGTPPSHHRPPVRSRSPSPSSHRRHRLAPETKRRRYDEPEDGPHPRTPPGSPPSLSVEQSDTAPSVEQSEPPPPLPPPTVHTEQPVEEQSKPHPPSPSTDVKVEEPPQADLADLLRKYPVIWQGHLSLKNDTAVIQFHFLSGNDNLARISLLQMSGSGQIPNFRISQRMRLEQGQLEGVEKRIQNRNDHCLLLGLPCGLDAVDIQKQTHTLQNTIISYLLQKQAAGIINLPTTQGTQVLHIFPPCPFSQAHLSQVAPDLLNITANNCHLMIVLAIT